MPLIGELGTISAKGAKGLYLFFEWNIENFLSLPAEDGSYYTSPEFELDGLSYRLVIYPYGWFGSDSVEYIDLFLFKESCGPPICVDFSIALKTLGAEKDNERHRTEVFGGVDFYGFLRSISRSDLLRRESELMPSGIMTVICTMKSKTPAGSSNDLNNGDDFDNIAFKSAVNNKRKRKAVTENMSDDGSLCQAFKKVLLDGLNHDLILKVGDKELRAHQDILRARSKVFRSMLSHEMSERNNGVLDIPDCDPHAMEQFLTYVYSGKVETLDQNNMLELYYIAKKYDMKELKEECWNFLKNSLSLTNISKVIQFAVNNSDSSLLEHATEYVIDNSVDIFRTEEWQSFMKGNFTAANDLIIKCFENKNKRKTRILK